MVEHGGIGGLEAGEQAPLVSAVTEPSLDAIIARRQTRGHRHDPGCLLPGKAPIALEIPSVHEQRIVTLDQLEGCLMWRMARTQRKPQEPRRFRVLGEMT